MVNTFEGKTEIGNTQTTGASTSSNDGDQEIIDAISAVISQTITSDNAFSITNVDPTWLWERAIAWIFTDHGTPPTALITIDVPAGADPAPARGTFNIINLTTQPMEVEITGQSLATPILDPGERGVFASDGSDVVIVSRTGMEEIHFFQHGAPGASDDIWIKVFNRETTVNDALAGSEGFAKGAPSGGDVTYDVMRNNTKIGEATFADGVPTATFATEAAQQYVFAVGDYMTIHSPANVQSMVDISFNIAGFRS